jgi:DNA-binding response OmpR family regulator
VRKSTSRSVLPSTLSQRSPVIVAVDDELTAGIVEATLRASGYPVLRALHGAHALKIVNKNKARVVIVDLNTSRRTGLEVIRFLQGHGSRDFLRVMAISVQNRSEAEEDAREAGADDFLLRPFDPGDLVRKVDRLFSRLATA